MRTGGDALRAFPSADLLLLDLELPDIDGSDVCRTVRAARDIPMIAVTARASELDRVLALQAGADDYVAKPYCFRELVARIGAVTRRANRRSPSPRSSSGARSGSTAPGARSDSTVAWRA